MKLCMRMLSCNAGLPASCRSPRKNIIDFNAIGAVVVGDVCCLGIRGVTIVGGLIVLIGASGPTAPTRYQNHC